MSFGAPGYLWLLLLMPVTLALFAAWVIWRTRARSRFGRGARSSQLGAWSGVLIVAALAVAAVAAARPQIGEREELVEERGIDLVIVLDVSQSMYASDVAPMRLGRAQAELVALLDRMQGDRVGLVIFAGRPFVRSPLTSDMAALARLAEGVHEERALVPAGSDLGSAIRRGRELIEAGDAETKALLVISDGEDHGSSISGAVREARERDIRVYAAGVGTEQGAPVVDIDPASGGITPRVDSGGQTIITRLDAGSLGAIAEQGGGAYVELADGSSLSGLAAELDALAATTFEAEERAEPIERWLMFAWVALALAFAGVVLPQFANASPRPGDRTASGWRRLWPLAGAGLFVGAVCVSEAAEVNRRGNQQYAAGEYAAALDSYRTAQALEPERRELLHNASNALHMAGRFVEAIDEAKRGLPVDASFTAKLEYALGSHYAAAERLSESFEAYKRALLAEPGDDDAKHNLEVIAQRLAATPSRTPTPERPRPEFTQTPGPADGDAGEPGDDGDASPEPGDPVDEGTPGTGTPQPPDDGELAPEELQRALDEALRGIDEEFTVEEALRVLDLLERRNRQLLEERGGSEGGAPDY